MRKHFHCVVPGCNSVDDGVNDEIKFYPFPKEDSVKKKWLKAINRNDEELNKRSKVCSKHFKQTDYSITRFNYTVGGKNNPSSNKNTCKFLHLLPSNFSNHPVHFRRMESLESRYCAIFALARKIYFQNKN